MIRRIDLRGRRQDGDLQVLLPQAELDVAAVLGDAVAPDPRETAVPSTKGHL